ncbi:MAG: winged helix-turn-helix transcriptional regulator [Methylocystis sp.]|nr:winged helix-turn-helix transcriptional regulator [Methylocystis sp.]
MAELDAGEIRACAQTCAAANVRKASRAVTRLYADFLTEAGVEPAQYSLLVACSIAEGVTVSKLAEALAMDRSALARNLSVMEKHGLLLVKPGDDRRTRKVALTRKGKSALANALPHWRAAQSKVEQKFGAERLRHLLGELQAFMKAAQAT